MKSRRFGTNLRVIEFQRNEKGEEPSGSSRHGGARSFLVFFYQFADPPLGAPSGAAGFIVSERVKVNISTDIFPLGEKSGFTRTHSPTSRNGGCGTGSHAGSSRKSTERKYSQFTSEKKSSE